MTLTFQQARAAVLSHPYRQPKAEKIPLTEAVGRVLAQDLHADRDFPALDRSVRDGFAVAAANLPGPLPVTLTIRAGDPAAELPGRQAAEIMTGAPMPAGADAVVMVEHAVRDGDLITHAAVPPGTFVSRRAEEAAEGERLLESGSRLDPSHIAMLASCGHNEIAVYLKPDVAILATGDELVGIQQRPLPHQIRNSNAYALAAQVQRAGAVPRLLGIAPDHREKTRALLDEGLSADLLLISGGVSAGKFDFVEDALGDLGAGFHFDRVRIQPGAPVVFGVCRERPFFGLPGNPASTLVTFEVLARAAINLLTGQRHSPLPLAYGRLTVPFRHKPGLTRFLPATVTDSGDLTPMPWHGSSDMPAVARANAFLVADADQEQWAAGDYLPLIWK